MNNSSKLTKLKNFKKDLLNSSIPLSSLLLDIKNFSEETNIESLFNICNKEIHGYLPDDVAPPFRTFTGVAKGQHPYHGLIDVDFESTDDAVRYQTKIIKEGIATIESSYILNKNDSTSFFASNIGRTKGINLVLLISMNSVENYLTKLRSHLCSEIIKIELTLKRKQMITDLIYLGIILIADLAIYDPTIKIKIITTNILLFLLIFLPRITIIIPQWKISSLVENVVANGVYDLLKYLGLAILISFAADAKNIIVNIFNYLFN